MRRRATLIRTGVSRTITSGRGIESTQKPRSASCIPRQLFTGDTMERGDAMTATNALRAKRIAIWAERKANEAAASTDPWWLGNLRVYQNMMVQHLKTRNGIIRAYIESRKQRT